MNGSRVMSDVFKRLALEAFDDPDTSEPSDHMYKFTDHKMQKFAELIIAELDKVLMDNHYNDPHEIPNFIEDVKKHFGVK